MNEDVKSILAVMFGVLIFFSGMGLMAHYTSQRANDSKLKREISCINAGGSMERVESYGLVCKFYDK